MTQTPQTSRRACTRPFVARVKESTLSWKRGEARPWCWPCGAENRDCIIGNERGAKRPGLAKVCSPGTGVSLRDRGALRRDRAAGARTCWQGRIGDSGKRAATVSEGARCSGQSQVARHDQSALAAIWMLVPHQQGTSGGVVRCRRMKAFVCICRTCLRTAARARRCLACILMTALTCFGCSCVPAAMLLKI